MNGPENRVYFVEDEYICGEPLPTSCDSPQDKEQMTTGIYTTKWFLQCFIDRVSVWIISTSLGKYHLVYSDSQRGLLAHAQQS